MKYIKLKPKARFILAIKFILTVFLLISCNKDEPTETPTEIILGRLLMEEAILTVYKDQVAVEHDTVTWEVKKYNDREKVTYWWYRNDFYDFNYKNNHGSANNLEYTMDGTLISETSWVYEWKYDYPNDTTMVISFYNNWSYPELLERHTYFYNDYEFRPHTVLTEDMEYDYKYTTKYKYTGFDKISELRIYINDKHSYTDVYEYDIQNNLIKITVNDLLQNDTYLSENNSYRYDTKDRISEGIYSMDLINDPGYYARHNLTYYDNNKIASELVSLSHNGMNGIFNIGGMLRYRYKHEFYTVFDGKFYEKVINSDKKSAEVKRMNPVVPLRKFRQVETPDGELITIRVISQRLTPQF